MHVVMPFKNPHPLYGIWQGMRRRCLTPTFRQWDDYGGRGITICKEWDSFARFATDMGPKPAGMSLDRKDNDLGYSPENCRWATKTDQQRNQRKTIFVTIEGVRYKAVELSDTSGWKTDTIVARAKMGLSYAEVMSSKKMVFVDGLKLGAMANGAAKRAKIHCKNGHEFTPDNTRITKEGWRNCRKCAAIKEARRRCSSRY